MKKKGFLLLEYVRDKMSRVYTEVAMQAESKKRAGFITPDAWAMQNYQAVLQVLSNGKGLPDSAQRKLAEAYQLASALHTFYEKGWADD